MSQYHKKLKQKMHAYIKHVYFITKEFPNEEMYGVTSQLRRSSLSVILNYIEGFARFRAKQKLHFYQIAYGSLKESKYLVYFSYTEKYIEKQEYLAIREKAEEL